MKYFLAGIKGAGMSALASMLKQNKNYVIGCDDDKSFTFTQKMLLKKKIRIYNDANKLKEDMIYIYSSAISDNHYSYIKAKNLNLKMYEYYEFIGNLSQNYKVIAVSGTHGKTTTAALLYHVLSNTIGANAIIGDGRGIINPKSDLLVLEACEYKKHFLTYNVNDLIITNIDYDHVDCYKNINEIIDTFSNFANSSKCNLIIYGDSNNTRKLKFNNAIFYGFNSDNDYICKNVKQNKNSTIFDIYKGDNYVSTFSINLIGNHNILNAMAVFIILSLYGIALYDIKNLFLTFSIPMRRFNEKIFDDNVLVDDYAHHPNEIKSVLDMCKIKYPNKKTVLVFIPYTYSRLQGLYNDFIKVLKNADYVYITDIEGARENSCDYNISLDKMLRKLKNSKYLSKNNIEVLQKHRNSVIIFTGCKDPMEIINLYMKG